MDFKKILILPLLFIGSTLLYIGCCQCMEHSKQFFLARSLFVQPYGSGNSVIDTGRVTTVDSLYFNYTFRGECVVKNESPLFFLGNTARATQCDCIPCGSEGLKNKVVSVVITSDSSYNNIPAHQPLNALFKLYNDPPTAFPFDSIVPTLNRPYGNYYGISLFTTVKPGNSQGHVFTLAIQFADGQTLFVDTRRIFWM
ncbi:MAG: hypothetical protein EOO13_11290 [Chitinophagaceae bacterium]|nr:MAG: hypothetical protein EOO13_11290 [Chitinophagaceae bacterium]